ncbi:MAG: hypothetical protein Tsb009_28080 [Planctomycetaceae bacterium]
MKSYMSWNHFYSTGIAVEIEKGSTMKTTSPLIHLTVIASLMAVTGCGGGTESDPTITAKPRKASPTVAGKTNGGGTKTPGNGSQPKNGSGPGTFSGTVVFDGAPPAVGAPSAFNPNDAKTDKFCVANKGMVKDFSLVVHPQTKGVKNVFVYLQKKPRGYTPKAAPKTPVVFDQKACTFVPHALALRAGQPVEVRNSDQTSHNTHTNPLSPGNDAYNKSLGPNQKDSFTYESGERLPVKVVCDIHNWMAAYHLPVDHEFFAITDENGKFKIEGLPPGDYSFTLWHEKSGYLEKSFEITIEGGDTVDEKFNYPASKFARFHGPAPKVVILSSTR